MEKSRAILLLLLMISRHDGSEGRIQTRSLANFGDMIHQATKRNPLDLNNYGNFCGRGGRGEPVDVIDECCHSHDDCYTQTREIGACSKTLGININIYSTGYDFTVKDGNITCNGGDFVSRLMKQEDCANALCACDKICTECFVANMAIYNETYKNGFIF